MGMVEMHGVEEGARVEGHTALQLTACEGCFEFGDVTLDERRVQAEVGRAEEEILGAQLVPQGRQDLGETMPGALRSALRPEEREEPVAAHTALPPRRKHGQQRQLAALRSRPRDRTALASERERAEGL